MSASTPGDAASTPTVHRMLVDLPDRLETERLALRRFRAGDGPEYLSFARRNRDHLARFETDNPARGLETDDEAEILVREFAADWASRRAFFLGMWLKAGGALVGQIYVGPVSWELPELEIGYVVDLDHEGRGYVSEAVRACLGLAFDGFGARRVTIRCSDLNERSARVAERCGFVREGHIRQNHRRVRAEDGTLGGELIYGLLRAEYEAQRRDEARPEQPPR